MEVRLAAFPDELQQLGWTNGRNVRIDTRWDAGSKHAEELVAQAPDVILASTSASVAALQWITRSVPIAFANVIDTVGAGFVESAPIIKRMPQRRSQLLLVEPVGEFELKGIRRLWRLTT